VVIEMINLHIKRHVREGQLVEIEHGIVIHGCSGVGGRRSPCK
jgi:hypothetical protein